MRLLDAFEVRREPPVNLRPEDEPMFAHEYHRAFGPTDMYLVDRAVVTADGVVIRRGKPLPGSIFGPDAARVGPRYVAGNLRRRRRRFREGRYLVAFNPWSGNNYFHWMCDVLPRIYLARSYVEGSTLVLPSSHDVPFVERSVAPFGLAGIAFFEPRTIASVRDAVIPGHIATTGNYHEPTMRALATLLRRHVLGGDASAPRRLVYVSRRRSAFRYVLNEDAVIEVVTRYGFEIVENEGLSFEEQVALYSETRFLIGIIGANLTNVMFMQPGGALLELAREGDAHNHLYWALAAAVGVRFGYQHCAYEDTREGDYWNLTVDPDLLARNIERMLEAA